MVALMPNKTYKDYGYVIAKAIKDGLITRPKKCSQCGHTGKINGHHEDYDKPLELVWLCNRCHIRLHYGVAWDAPDRGPKGRSLPADQTSIYIDRKQYALPSLRKEPYITSGLLLNYKEVDGRNYFSKQNINWQLVLDTLTYREREIVKLRYGIHDGYCYTLKEVGVIFKCTRERVRQLEALAIRKLQHPRRVEMILRDMT